MTKEQKRPIDIIAAFDQADAVLSNVAKLAGSYYKELKLAGLPDDLADGLVRDWHQELLQSLFPENHKGQL